jgi:hypothetical protein
LEAQESQQRAKAKEKILEIQEDVKGMLENPNYPNGMKQILKEVLDNLDRDIRLLEKGAAINKLSFVIESKEVLSVERPNIELEEIEQIEIGEVAEKQTGTTFSTSASRWLNSSWDVSWGDIINGESS